MRRALICFVITIIRATCWTDPAGAQTPPGDGWVVLPVDEYRTLRERSVAPSPSPVSPIEATLTRIDYDLRLEGESVIGRASLTIDVLRDGWTRVQIPAGLLARDARLEGRPVSLIKGPPPHVLLARAGRSVLELDVVFPLTMAADTGGIVVPPSPSPISRTTLVLPRGGMDLTVNGGVLAERGEDANQSRWTSFGRPNQPLTLTWKRKFEDRRAEQPLRFRARIIEMVGLGEETSQITASVKVEVVQGLAREIALQLPQGLVVNQVNGAAVVDWNVDSSVLHARFLEPVATETAFVVQAEFRAPREGRMNVPIMRAVSAERESGGVAVDVLGAGEIAGQQARNLDPADISEIGDVVSGRESPSMVAFRMRPLPGGGDRSLAVSVVRYTPQAVLVANVEEARYRTLASEDGQLLVEARYAVRNNQRSFLKVQLPTNATMWSASVAGRPMRPGAAEAGALLLPLEKGRIGEEAPTFVVSVIYLQPIDTWPEKGRVHIELPVLDLPVSRTGLQLHYSPRFVVQPVAGSFRVEQDPGPFAEALRMPAPRAATTPRPAAAVLDTAPDAGGAGLQSLVDRYQNDAGGRTVVGALPVNVTFPSFGPSLYLDPSSPRRAGHPRSMST